MKLAKLAAIFAIILNTSCLLLAQSQPNTENGVKSFGSYTGSDIDTVNLQNGNVMLHIPLLSYPQRGGLGLGYSVQLNSKNWQVGQYTGTSQSLHYRWMLSGQPGLFLTSSYDVQLQRVRTITTDVNGAQSYQRRQLCGTHAGRGGPLAFRHSVQRQHGHARWIRLSVHADPGNQIYSFLITVTIAAR